MKQILRTTGLALVLVLLSGLTLNTALAQSGVTWSGSFYDNGALRSPSELDVTVGAIAFNWGTGSPDNDIDDDEFSARFGADPYFTGGTYRFYVLADDGVKLWVDYNNLLIDTFHSPRPGQLLTADITLPPGTHHVQLDYHEVSGEAYVYLDWQNLASNPTGPSFGSPAPAPVTGGSWVAQYYTNTSLSGSPVVVQGESSPSHNWGSGAPVGGVGADNWSARWTSTQNLSGAYQLSVRADDGVRVYVDGVPYINEFHGATGQTYTTNFTVAPGTHTITIEYYEAGGNASLDYNLTQIGGGTAPQPFPVSSGPWTAQYYANNGLSGSPSAIISETSPSHDWGGGAPFGSIPADNWSARWTSVQNLNAGTYTISVRADDGVRVYVNGVSYINEWHNATGQTYSTNVTLPAGSHTIVVEYYEAGGNAFLDFSFSGAGSGGAPVNTGATATVNAGRLNFRSGPGVGNTILGQVTRGSTYPVLARSQDNGWLLLDISGTQGWVSARFVTANNVGSAPVGQSPTSPTTTNPTGFVLTATQDVNVRSGPGVQFPRVTVLFEGQQAQIIGRTVDSIWYKVSVNGTLGWVSTGFFTLQPNVSNSQIPVVS